MENIINKNKTNKNNKQRKPRTRVTNIETLSDNPISDNPISDDSITTVIETRSNDIQTNTKATTKKNTNLIDNKSFVLNGIQKQLVDKYIHFIPQTHHYLLFSILSDDIQFIHFHIFAVWFMSNCNIHHLDFISLFKRFKHIPFHSFILHIHNTTFTDTIPFIIDF